MRPASPEGLNGSERPAISEGTAVSEGPAASQEPAVSERVAVCEGPATVAEPDGTCHAPVPERQGVV
jgi:hypothetical protein